MIYKLKERGRNANRQTEWKKEDTKCIDREKERKKNIQKAEIERHKEAWSN